MALGQRIVRDVDVDLAEYLARAFDVGYMRARGYARRHSFDEFADNFRQLEILIGNERATEVVQQGSFLDYRNGTLNNYMNLVRAAVGSENDMDASHLYSIESLESLLTKDSSSGTDDGPDIDGKHIGRLRLLHKDNEDSRSYLTALIKEGKLEVGRSEHWCKSDKATGLRGGDILVQLRYELNQIIDICGYNPSDHSIDIKNTGMRVMKIDEGVQNILNEVRDAAYEKQN